MCLVYWLFSNAKMHFKFEMSLDNIIFQVIQHIKYGHAGYKHAKVIAYFSVAIFTYAMLTLFSIAYANFSMLK